MKKIEVLMENFWWVIGFKVCEIKDVYEGEVIEFILEEVENFLGGYGKIISILFIGFKSV